MYVGIQQLHLRFWYRVGTGSVTGMVLETVYYDINISISEIEK